MSEATTIQKVSVTSNGISKVALRGTISRGDHKGKPVFAPEYRDGKVPDIGELTEFLTFVGQKPLLTTLGRTIRSLFTDASIAAAKPDGKGGFTLDTGDFVAALQKEVAEMESGTKDAIQAELTALEQELNKVMGEALPFMAKNQPVPAPLANKMQQLVLKRSPLLDKLAKKTRTKKSAEKPAEAAA
jgi:hypothetical protein